ncbi:hypothetical protein LXA43DRAFT_1060316 [Ganoderma leucocontextum]|nr:hypothetical protein LXA43DRAFT_1060316 [Ganoderma leucocontextum]
MSSNAFRSKRTPIACTECRRRQVKCSGTTPRCERCTKKNIECTYVSLSDQRAGGPISRSGTPAQASQSHSHLGSSATAAAAASHAHAHGHGNGYSSGRLSHSSASQLGWQAATSQGYSTPGSGYPAASQGWQAGSPGSSPVAHGMQSNQNQAYAGVPMAFPNSYGQQATYPGQADAGDIFANQGYAAQQGFPGGASYDPYGHAISTADPRYAYQAAQMAAMAGEDPQSAAYMGQFSQQQTQMFFDLTSGQMISADVAAQWAENPNAAFQGQSYSGRN